MAPGCRGRFLGSLLFAAAGLAIVPRCDAQTPVDLHLDSAIYVDNAEFDGPFRSGETILGSFQMLFFDIAPAKRTVLRVGVFGLERAGSCLRSPEARPDRGIPDVSIETCQYNALLYVLPFLLVVCADDSPG